MSEIKTTHFTSYPFATCPNCRQNPCQLKTIKDDNYFEHNTQWIIFKCLGCGECFKAE